MISDWQAFASNNFREANERAMDAAAEAEASLANLRKQQRETEGQAIRAYRLGGRCRLQRAGI